MTTTASVASAVQRVCARAPLAAPRIAVVLGSGRGALTERIAAPLRICCDVELGGGQGRAGDAVDHRVGLNQVAGIGRRVEAGDLLATVHAADVHAADEPAADVASARLATLFTIADAPPAPRSVLIGRVESEAFR